MDLAEILTSFLIFACTLGLCGVCGREFGVHVVGYKAGSLGKQTGEFKVQSL